MNFCLLRGEVYGSLLDLYQYLWTRAKRCVKSCLIQYYLDWGGYEYKTQCVVQKQISQNSAGVNVFSIVGIKLRKTC